MSWSGYRFELRLRRHGFNHLELARDDAAVLRVFGNVSGLRWGPQGPQIFDTGSFKMEKIDPIRRGGYRYELRILRHHFTSSA